MLANEGNVLVVVGYRARVPLTVLMQALMINIGSSPVKLFHEWVAFMNLWLGMDMNENRLRPFRVSALNPLDHRYFYVLKMAV